jgi:hypothetical protein
LLVFSFREFTVAERGGDEILIQSVPASGRKDRAGDQVIERPVIVRPDQTVRCDIQPDHGDGRYDEERRNFDTPPHPIPRQAATGGETTELWAALQMVLMLLEKVEYRL